MSSSFLQGFQGGLGSIMSIYDLKHRRAREKKQDARQAKLDARQEKLWERQDQDYDRKTQEQKLKDSLLFEDTIGAMMDGDPSKMTPGFYQATSRLYGDTLNQGYGKNKSLDRIVPTPDGKNWMAELSVEDEKSGENYKAPLTVNRSNDKNDQVRLFSPDDIAEWYSEVRRTTAHLPPEERAKLLGQAKENAYLLAGDSSIRDTRIKRAEEDRVYTRERRDKKTDRSADHDNSLAIENLKQRGLTSRSLIKGSSSGKPIDPRLIQNDIYKRFGAKFTNELGQVDFGDEEPVINRLLSIGGEFQQVNPGVLDTDTTVLLLQKAREGLSFSPEEAQENAELEWEKISGGGNVVRTPQGRMRKSKFVDEYVKAAPAMAEKAIRNKFYRLVEESIHQRGGAISNPLSRRGDQTPRSNMTDADWMAQKRREQDQRQPIPIYGKGDRQEADIKLQVESKAKGILDSVDMPMAGADIDKILGHGMKALRSGAPTQSVVDALRKQGIREDLIRGLVDGTTGKKYQ